MRIGSTRAWAVVMAAGIYACGSDDGSSGKSGNDAGGAAGQPAEQNRAGLPDSDEASGGQAGSAGSETSSAGADGTPEVPERGEGRDEFGMCPMTGFVCTGIDEYFACFAEACGSYNEDCYGLAGDCATQNACIMTCDCGDTECEVACATDECAECTDAATGCAIENGCVELMVCGPAED